jgi:outer membrane protein with beta-barrel domain
MTRDRLLFALFLLFALVTLEPAQSSAQVAPSAFKSPLSLTAGGMVSGFQPDYVDSKLIGLGAYVDLTIFHGIGIEAEGRWQRFNQLDSIYQDNYLIGPRVKLHRFWRATPYVKALGGFSNMNFEDNIAHGRFTTVAFGGGIDLKVSRRWSVRAIDGEYQIWPDFLGSNLKPYGLSAGIGYKIF